MAFPLLQSPAASAPVSAGPRRREMMLTSVWLAALCVGAPSGRVWAQDDTAHARQVYADINKSLKHLKRVSTKAKRADVSYQSAVRAWAEGDGSIRKIEVTDADDSGDLISEYYYQGGALVFVYVAVKGFDSKGKQVTRNEERQYFQENRMFKWLSGMDKVARSPRSADFAAEDALRNQASRTYLTAVQTALRSGK